LPDLYLLQSLEEHAERRASGYYLTKAVVRGDRTSGESAGQIIARWQRWHHGPIPAAVMEKLREWLRV